MNCPTDPPDSQFPPTADFTLDFRSEALRQLYRYWLSKLDDRPLPSRADIDPTEIPHLLRYIVLIDVEHEPLRLRFRLVGTHITDAVGRDSTGRFFDEVYEGDILTGLLHQYGGTIDAKRPARHFSRAIFAGKDYRHYESAHLPLSEDGDSVNMILVGLQFFE
jgi:hypothetical protein